MRLDAVNVQRRSDKLEWKQLIESAKLFTSLASFLSKSTQDREAA